jgi:putative ABC transport system permease protein
MTALLAEVRQAARALRRSPGFALAAVMTLGLGIGANTAIFSVLNAVLLRPLPYPEADRLEVVSGLNRAGEQVGLAPADFLDLRGTSGSFEAMAGYRTWIRNLLAGDRSDQVHATVVTADFFPLLGRLPALGRLPDSPDEAVISERLWRTRFGARRDLPGQLVSLDGHSFTVVGVMPSGFSVPIEADLWLPSPFAVPPHPLQPELDLSASRDQNYFETIARLRHGVRREAAAAEVSRLQAEIARTAPGGDAVGAVLTPLRDDRVGDTRTAILILFGSTALLLLIACANLANLALVRFAAQERQWILRAALGATRMRLLRTQLVESLLVAALGGGLGLLLAVWGVAACRRLAPWSLQPLIDPTPDLALLGFTLLASVLTGLGFGLVPLLHGTRALATGLREGGAGSGDSGRRRRTRGLLVISEVALAFMLTVGAGLLVKAFVRIQQVPLGLNPRRVLTMSLALPRIAYPDPTSRSGFVERLLEGVAGVPGIAAVSVVSRLPLNPGNSRRGYMVEGTPAEQGDGPAADYLVASPGYFNAIGIPLRHGRDFAEQDRVGAPPVAIVSEQLAAQLWPGASPIGRRITLGDTDWREVIGVVGDVRQHRLDKPPAGTIYLPYAQDPWPSLTLVIRTRSDPETLAGPIEREIHALDRGQAVAAVRSMETVIDDSLVARRFTLLLIGLFAALALALTAVGVYGVIAYGVNQRTREVGIRLALGATPGEVLRLVLGNGARLTAVGLGLGIVGALWLAPVLRGLLFAVAPIDGPTFGSVILVVVCIALAATWLPARRAARVDPMSALRAE